MNLCPELKSSITKIGGMPWIHNRYLITVYGGTDFEKEIYNRQYAFKVKHMAELLKAGKVGEYLALVERPYRLEAMLEIFANYPAQWEIKAFMLRKTWIDCEAPHTNIHVWKSLFSDPRFNKFYTGTKKGLPKEFLIFRGYQGEFDDGISWTLDKEKAEWFANRFNKKGVVKALMVRREDVIAYFNDRQEQEIIYIEEDKI